MATERVRKFRSGFVAVGTVAATIPTTIASAKMVGTGEDHEAFLREVGVWEKALGEKLTDDLERIAQAHAENESISIPIYDWAISSYGVTREINPREILIIEGVGSAQEIIRSHKAITIWMEIDPEFGVQRVLERDGHHIATQMKAWQIIQSEHFAQSGARENADFIITAQ